MDTIRIYRAAPDDAAALLSLIEALARYEKLQPPDAAAQARLIRDMTSHPPRFDAFLADFDGRVAAYAIVFETYSSFLALPTLYLEDIFVLPELRKKGIGHALFRTLVGEALQRGCGRMEWTVLDWNRPALDFYRRCGARHMSEWQLYRLTREEMERIAAP